MRSIWRGRLQVFKTSIMSCSQPVGIEIDCNIYIWYPWRLLGLPAGRHWVVVSRSRIHCYSYENGGKSCPKANLPLEFCLSVMVMEDKGFVSRQLTGRLSGKSTQQHNESGRQKTDCYGIASPQEKAKSYGHIKKTLALIYYSRFNLKVHGPSGGFFFWKQILKDPTLLKSLIGLWVAVNGKI